MEEKLKKLFEYQRFIQNEHLNQVIGTSQQQESVCVELSDDQLFAAAGGKNNEVDDIDRKNI